MGRGWPSPLLLPTGQNAAMMGEGPAIILDIEEEALYMGMADSQQNSPGPCRSS